MKKNEGSYEEKISVYRDNIDSIDKKLVALLEYRMNLSRAIGLLKKEYGIDILDKNRESIIIENRAELLSNKDYKIYLKDIFKKIIETSRDLQT